MLKKLAMVIAITVVWTAVLPAQAQSADNWYAFLYNGITRQLLRVGMDGSSTMFDLGVGPNVFLGGQDMAFSPDGSRVAYCANRANPDSPQGDTVVVVRDLAAGANIMELPLGGSIGCRVTRSGFNADASQVAVGVVRYYPNAPDMDTSGPIWRLAVVDVASSSIVAELNSESPVVGAAGVAPNVAMLPDVRYFDGSQVIFAEVPWGIGGAPEWNAFIWQSGAGTLQLDTTGRWGKSGVSFLAATGELVWLDNDPNLPASTPGGPIPTFNVVKLADRGGVEKVIYQNGEWVLVNTQFINGGAQLGVLLLSTFDAENPGQQQSRWIALGRDGAVSELAAGTTFSQLAGAPGGAVLFELAFSADFTQQSFTLSLIGEQNTVLWQADDPGWEFASATPVASSADLPPFPAA